jgi:hypothetical protein
MRRRAWSVTGRSGEAVGGGQAAVEGAGALGGLGGVLGDVGGDLGVGEVAGRSDGPDVDLGSQSSVRAGSGAAGGVSRGR